MHIHTVTPLICHLNGRNFTFVKVVTSDGIVGYGEATNAPEATAGAISGLSPFLVGRDPMQIALLWQEIYQMHHNVKGGSIFTSAMSGIEQALWDIKGKLLNVPVYELLGGRCWDRLRAYWGDWHRGARAPEEFAERALAAVDQGWSVLKWDPFGSAGLFITDEEIRLAVARVEAVRRAVGDGVELAIEAHGRLSPTNAIKVAHAIEEYRPYWFEEPVPPENVDAMVLVARATRVPIATGERLYTRWGFRELLEKQAAAIIQPDLCHAGGILECKKIAAMAHTYYIAVAPHSPFGPLSLAAAVQLDVCTPNFLIQELGSGRLDVVKEPLEIKDGYITVPTRPGLGIELDEERIAAHPYQWAAGDGHAIFAREAALVPNSQVAALRPLGL
ncbi:MAG: galactonate dehydratase [Chloroflexota bacterium]